MPNHRRRRVHLEDPGKLAVLLAVIAAVTYAMTTGHVSETTWQATIVLVVGYVMGNGRIASKGGTPVPLVGPRLSSVGAGDVRLGPARQEASPDAGPEGAGAVSPPAPSPIAPSTGSALGILTVGATTLPVAPPATPAPQVPSGLPPSPPLTEPRGNP